MTSTFGESPLDDRLREALARDIAATARRLGIASMRAAVVDPRSMSPDAGWALAPRTDAPDSTSGGDSTLGDAPDSELGANTGFQAELAELADLDADEMLLRRQSPRRWAFGWRLDRRRAIVGAVLFTERQERIDPSTEAWLRVLADTGLRMRGGASAGSAGGATGAQDDHLMSWPQVERRAPQKPTRADITLLALSFLGVLLSALLLGYLLPRWQDAHEAQRERLEQLVARGERTAALRLCEALSRGDYGDVQTELSSLATLGYFADAAVSNTRGRVVALVGKPPGLAIGSPAPADGDAQFRRTPLTMGAQTFGTLWLLPQAEEPGELPLTAGLTAAAMTGLASLVSALVAGRRMGRRRR